MWMIFRLEKFAIDLAVCWIENTWIQKHKKMQTIYYDKNYILTLCLMDNLSNDGYVSCLYFLTRWILPVFSVVLHIFITKYRITMNKIFDFTF